MRPVGLLLRLPPTVGGSIRRRRPLGPLVALVLVAVAGVPPAGAVTGPAPASRLIAALPQPFGTTSVVSVARNGGFANAASGLSAISANGRFVVFVSFASNLVADDVNEGPDLFVRDLQAGTTERALFNGQPFPVGSQVSDPSISGNGRIVAFTLSFTTSASVARFPPVVMAWDRATGEVTVVSRTIQGDSAPGRAAAVSGNGRYIAYVSNGAPMVPGDDRNIDNVFRFDRQTETTELVSADMSGEVASGASDRPAISANGRRVAFDSIDTRLVPDGTAGGRRHVYVRNMNTGVTTRVSVNAAGAAADGESDGAAISADGSRIAFSSVATNLVDGDTNEAADVFVRDLGTGTTSLASLGDDGRPSNRHSGEAAISANGRIVAFASGDPALIGPLPVVGAAPGGVDLAAVMPRLAEVYARDMVAGETALISVAAVGGPGGSRSASPSIGANGRFVAFDSNSSRILPGDDNESYDVFVRDLPPIPSVEPAAIDFGTRPVGEAALAGAATVRNDGWGPLAVDPSTIAGRDAGDFSILVDGCDGALLYRTEACSVSVGFAPTDGGNRVGSLRIPNNFEPEPRRVRLVGVGEVGPEPFLGQLELSPENGPPGIVTVATGSGFEPGTTIGLRWSRGLTPNLPPIVVDADGGFTVQVLVFHNDQVGERDLEAQLSDGPPIEPVTATFRVVPGPGQPPSYAVLRLLSMSPVTLVGRR